MQNKLLLLIALSAISTSSFAGVVKGKTKSTIFKNTNCKATDTCDLKEFKVESYDFKVTFSDKTFSLGTSAFMSYTTQDVANLEDYAIVQQIKGCHFDSYKNPATGEVEKTLGYSREFFGEIIKYKHSNWVIDSIDTDPMYNNSISGLRHGSHRWNTVKGSYDKKTEKLYGRELPKSPTLYVSDLPGSAFIDSGFAKNISLQFKTCIYKTRDIPLILNPEDVNFKEAISCLNWSSSFIYNHDSAKYETKTDIDPVCLNP